MSTTTTIETTTEEPAAPKLYWWRELITIAAFYGLYTLVRNKGLDHETSVLRARHHADQIIGFEKFFGAFQEQAIQNFFIGSRGFIRFWNIFYGSAHFIVTIVAIVLLFTKGKHRYAIWRNTLAVTVALALIGFTFYPLMPPRLLPASFGFVDTLQKIGGLWSFDSGTMSKISNQYAAMPSLHMGWSTWCAFVLVPMIKPLWGKVLMASYPFITLFCIVVTANHYWADALGGWAALGLGYLIGGKLLTNTFAKRVTRRTQTISA